MLESANDIEGLISEKYYYLTQERTQEVEGTSDHQDDVSLLIILEPLFALIDMLIFVPQLLVQNFTSSDPKCFIQCTLHRRLTQIRWYHFDNTQQKLIKFPWHIQISDPNTPIESTVIWFKIDVSYCESIAACQSQILSKTIQSKRDMKSILLVSVLAIVSCGATERKFWNHWFTYTHVILISIVVLTQNLKQTHRKFIFNDRTK